MVGIQVQPGSTESGLVYEHFFKTSSVLSKTTSSPLYTYLTSVCTVGVLKRKFDNESASHVDIASLQGLNLLRSTWKHGSRALM
jgi:hypothetical protein